MRTVFDPDSEGWGGPQPDRSTAVVRSRLEANLDFRFPIDALDDAEDLMFGNEHPFLLLLGENRHQVGEAHLAVVGVKLGDEHVRILGVTTAG
jgi:hypothetical protein